MAYTVINKPASYFNTVLYTGDDTTSRSITGVGFKPDFTWIKSRSNAYYHELYDAVRGFSSTTNGRVLYSNVTSAEGTPNTFNSFNTDGFTVSKQTGETGTNGTGSTYVAWNWLGANTTVSNTSGSITSTVSANTTSGFSIVSYTGTGANATVGHGLGVAPKMIIARGRGYAANWIVWHIGIGTGNALILNSTAASGSGWWNNTAPTSTVFSLDGSTAYNNSGQSIIAYCFADVKGYSKFGSYTGNGSDNGTFVYTGFKPAFVLVKRTDSTGYWYLWDSARGTYNYNGLTLFPNDASAEASYTPSNPVVDFLSNGFKLRGSYPETNASGGTIIYMAFAENPFVSATAIPTTAR
jgi:hypothetical protein